MPRERFRVVTSTRQSISLTAGKRASAYCAVCGRVVETVSVEELTVLLWFTHEKRLVHPVLTGDGTMRICCNSLLPDDQGRAVRT